MVEDRRYWTCPGMQEGQRVGLIASGILKIAGRKFSAKA
jgi:hypothetical protein